MNRLRLRMAVSTLVLLAYTPLARAADPKNFGTQNVTYYRVGPIEFLPVNNASAPYTSWSPDTDYTFRTWTTSSWLFATPHLPAGALLTSLELDACDTNDTYHLRLQLYDCDRFASCSSTPIATLSTFDLGPGCGSVSIDLTPANYTVDNLGHGLLLWVKMDITDGTNRLGGAVIGYKLQVSPAPVSPTFNDVPTSDVGFQYIEALAASGITGGCGGNNYCPDNPVTRRQMAIFLAKALGLSY